MASGHANIGCMAVGFVFGFLPDTVYAAEADVVRSEGSFGHGVNWFAWLMVRGMRSSVEEVG